KPQYKIEREFLRDSRIWSHCKNSKAFLDLVKYQDVNCFFQIDEEYVITSKGNIWAHSKTTSWNNRTIIFKPSSYEIERMSSYNLPYGICSDFMDSSYDPKQDIPFDLLIIDIDGIMTDGTKMYDRDGRVFGKTYCDLDFTAIKRFKAAGINVCFLSGDKTVNQAMAETRKIDFFHNESGKDKADMLPFLKEKYGANKVAYVGDDYYDIGIMNVVDLAFCPKNSPQAVKQATGSANNWLPLGLAGQGVIAHLYDRYKGFFP